LSFWEKLAWLEEIDVTKLSKTKQETARDLLNNIKHTIENETLYLFHPLPKGEPFLLAKNKEGKIARGRIFRAPNKVSKTTLGIVEDLCHAYGERVWLPKNHPDRIIDVPLPNIGIVFGKQLMKQVKLKLVPETKFWCPKSWLVQRSWEKSVRHSSQGVVCELRIKNRKGSTSTIYFFSYDSPAATHEGIDADWIHFDEPSPQNIFISTTRGFLSTGGRYWMSMTPLEQPWIYDVLESKSIDEGGDSHDIRVFSCNIWDALKKYYPKMYIKYFPKAGLTKKDIDDYSKDLDPDERDARLKGKWKHFAGVVYKALDANIHLINDFRIPKNWTPYEGIDPHDGKATKWLFTRISDEKFTGADGKTMYRMYVVGYLNLSPKKTIGEMVDEVKIKRAKLGYEKPKWVVIDAKYGKRQSKSIGETFCWETELKKADRGTRYILSDSKPGDVDLGIKIVKDYLSSKFSVSYQKEIPTLVFFRNACSGEGGVWWEMTRYRRDIDGDIIKENDDFPDCLRYICAKKPVNVDRVERKWGLTSYEEVINA
jgi:hypothetical protein